MMPPFFSSQQWWWFFSTTREKTEVRHDRPHKSISSLKWTGKSFEIHVSTPVIVSLSKTLNCCLWALTPFSEMSHEYESQRNVKWNKFMIKLCTAEQLQKNSTFYSVTARHRIYSPSLCHSHLSSQNVLEQDSEQFTNCKWLHMGVSKM